MNEKTKEFINKWGSLILAITSLFILAPILSIASVYLTYKTLNKLIKENTLFLQTKPARQILYNNIIAVGIAGASLGTYVLIMLVI